MLLKSILAIVATLFLGAPAPSSSASSTSTEEAVYYDEKQNVYYQAVNPLHVDYDHFLKSHGLGNLIVLQTVTGPFTAPDPSHETPAPETPAPDRPTQSQEDGNCSPGSTAEESWTMWLAAVPQPGILLGTLGLQFSSIFRFFSMLLDFIGFFYVFEWFVCWIAKSGGGNRLVEQARWVKSRYDGVVARHALPSKAELKEVILEYLANHSDLVQGALRAGAEQVANEAALRATPTETSKKKEDVDLEGNLENLKEE